jgi:hypothetical protein
MKTQLLIRVWLVRVSAIVLLTMLFTAVPVSVGAKDFDFSVDDFNSRVGREDDAQADLRDDHLGSDSYVDSTFGFSVAWDEDVWSASEPDKDVADNGVSLVSEKSEGLIVGFPKDRSLEECVEISAQGIENLPDFSEFGPAPERYERPELSNDAAGKLFVAVGSESGDEIAFYIECRQVRKSGSIVLISFGTKLDDYEGELPAWQEVYDSIETGD